MTNRQALYAPFIEAPVLSRAMSSRQEEKERRRREREEREQAQASPLQARSAHGLDPLEYRASGVRRTRATLTVVVCSVIVAIAAVVIAIKL